MRCNGKVKKVFCIFLISFFLVGYEYSQITSASANAPLQNLGDLCKSFVKVGDSCCRSSLKRVKKYSYLVLNQSTGPTICPKQTEKDKLKCVNSCPEGTQINAFSCFGSLTWCEPPDDKKKFNYILDNLCKKSDGCCQASLKRVKKHSNWLSAACPKQTDKDSVKCLNTCPKGTIPHRLKCKTSLGWCGLSVEQYKKNFYSRLERECKSDSCCQASVKKIREKSIHPSLILLSNSAVCSKETREEQLVKCPTSLKWCKP